MKGVVIFVAGVWSHWCEGCGHICGRGVVTFANTGPVLILGPLKEEINRMLVQEFPDKFEGCVPRECACVYVKGCGICDECGICD